MRLFVALLIVAAAAQTGCSRSTQQKEFASADEAVQALVTAARSGEKSDLLAVLGKEAGPLVDSGDPVQDRNSREKFLEDYTAAHTLDDSVAGVVTLNVGADNWPFPIPLKQSDGHWRFDGVAGVEEVINRRVGENELATIQSCLAFVDAEREYYVRNPQKDPLLHYAQKLISSDGQKDGLYWPTAGEEPPSPLGESFAQARAEGYLKEGAAKLPFHGYVYKLLKSQGSNAAGGAYEYMVGDKMLGGFALIAFPAEYGSSGVMTFMVNHDGVVFSRDLGPETLKLAGAIEVFDPDQSWQREATIN
ncbi:MAG TPA: DUF2950 domain-containing protein [Povalibacter sp.]